MRTSLSSVLPKKRGRRFYSSGCSGACDVAIGDLNCLVQSLLRHLTYYIPMVQNSIIGLQPDLICENQLLPANSSLEKISSKVGLVT